MKHPKTMAVNNESDIVLLRLHVRDLARAIGMNLADQARISLAASSVAKAIGLSAAHHGSVTIDDCCCDERTGVRVICTGKNGKTAHASDTLGDVRWMVDELAFEVSPSHEVQVTLVKWRE